MSTTGQRNLDPLFVEIRLNKEALSTAHERRRKLDEVFQQASKDHKLALSELEPEEMRLWAREKILKETLRLVVEEDLDPVMARLRVDEEETQNQPQTTIHANTWMNTWAATQNMMGSSTHRFNALYQQNDEKPSRRVRFLRWAFVKLGGR